MVKATQQLQMTHIVFPVVEIQKTGEAVSVSVVLNKETEKPTLEFTDEFWMEFRNQALYVLTDVYWEVGFIHLCIILSILPFCLIVAMEPLDSIGLTMYLTAGWFIHSEVLSLSSLRLQSRLFAALAHSYMLFVCGVTSLLYVGHLQSLMLFLLCAASWYCFPFAEGRFPCTEVVRGQDSDIEAFLHSVSTNCQSNLKGYQVALVSQDLGDGRELRCFSLDPIIAGDGEVHNIPSKDCFVHGTNELRVFFSSKTTHFSPCERDGTDSHFLCKSGAAPPGVSPSAWERFVDDLSKTFATQEKVANRIPVVMSLHIIVSAVCFVAHGAVNVMLPLHMTAYMVSDIAFRKKMKWKFDVIDKLGCSTFGPSCQVSYNMRRWFSRSDDYIAFKRQCKDQYFLA